MSALINLHHSQYPYKDTPVFRSLCWMGVYLLPVIIPPIPLCELSVEIDEMTREQQVVLRRYCHGVPHECGGVQCEGGRKFAGDAAGEQ